MSEYYRLSGGGNDFLALVEPPGPPSAEEIRAWCRRGLSLGADGLFLLRRVDGGARIDHYNPDGKPTELCVNGARCAARLAIELGWAESALVLQTGVGPVPARRAGRHEVALTLPAPAPAVELTLELEGRRFDGWLIDTGVPHYVTVWPRPLGDVPVAELGPPLRRHSVLGEAGANIDFVRYTAPGRLEIRTFERGVEAETLACGTGVIAAAVVGWATGRLDGPVRALTAGGFELAVGEAAEDRLSLAGDARLLAVGTLHAAAAALPGPPAWS